MNSKKTIFTIIIGLLLCLPPYIEAQVNTGTVSGKVLNTQNKPVTSATIILLDTFYGTKVSTDGSYKIKNILPGKYIVQVSAFGQQTISDSIEVKAGQNLTYEATLSLNPHWLTLAAQYTPLEPTHLSQKQSYLENISSLDKKAVPNIVLIFFDDLGYGDLSCYGNQLIQTPNIDKLAKSGVQMNQFYSSSPVCTPSRAGLLTGRYPVRSASHKHVFFPENSPIAFFRKVLGRENAIPQDEILLPEVLQKAGYKTGMIGKWHLGDKKGHLPNDLGFEDYYGVHFSNDMQPFPVYRNEEIVIPADKVNQHQLTENYTQEANHFIDKNKNEPFFLYFAHTFPHVPHFASEEHAGESNAALYGDVVEDLDRSVGALVAHLKKNNLLENTLIIITSDNGADYHGSAGNLRGRKGDTYEGGQRVPMIVYWQKKLKPQVSEEMAMNIDIMPTLLKMLNIEPPQDRIMDGKNLMPVWKNKSKSPHEHLFYYTAWEGELVGIRNNQYKYHEAQQKPGRNIFYPIPSNFASFAEETLSNLYQDNESHNLIDKHSSIAGSLKKALKEEQQNIAQNPRGWK